ncbi:hypothetical protein [Actinomadura sp. 3N508]|uniref:hypothetical protein n=1 Tax=Actinomadura sp. 3N508 TaxID=3375153 RepID=UPI0037A13948
MSAVFRAPTIIVRNEGFDDETGLLEYTYADAEGEVLATATDSKRRNGRLFRIAPPLEPKPFRFDLMLRAPDGAQLLRIEKRQRFPQRVWTRVTGPKGEVIGFATGPFGPFASWAFALKDVNKKALAHVKDDHGRRILPKQGPLSYTCRRGRTEIAQLVATRYWQTKVRGTRDFFNRFGNEYTLQISGEVDDTLRMLIVAFPIIADVSRNFMAHNSHYTLNRTSGRLGSGCGRESSISR